MANKTENKSKQADESIHIVDVHEGTVTFHLLGMEALFHNCLSNKAKHELLLPSGRKNEAEKKSTLKHVPLDEFRSSVYVNMGKGPTLIQHLASAFRGAMRTAALDLPGVTKSEIGRMIRVRGDHQDGDRVDIYGIPFVDMRIVRQAGMNRTPDVRTRAIMPEWACKITVKFVIPQLKEQAIANLLTAAGLYIGIGDGRNEKGALSYGLFRIVDENDADYKRIVKAGGRAAQVAAMENPVAFNDETEELLSWYKDAVKTHRSFAPLKGKAKAETLATAGAIAVTNGKAKRGRKHGEHAANGLS
jgi:hypothetical protein